jgi:hypothetical protein
MAINPADRVSATHVKIVEKADDVSDTAVNFLPV